MFLADTQEEGDKRAFPLPVVPVEGGTSFLPAHPSCSLAPGAEDFCLPQIPSHQHTQRPVSQLEPA